MFKKKFITILTAVSLLAAITPAVFADETDEEVEPAPLIDINSDDSYESTPEELQGPPVIDYSNSTYLDNNGNPIDLPSATSSEISDDNNETGTNNDAAAPSQSSEAEPASGGASGPMGMMFEDVKRGAWYYDVVAQAYMMGLISGMSDTEFSPDSAVTGGQLVMMLFRAAGNEVSEQTTENWYDEAVSWAAQNEIITSEIGWSFNPDDILTREQMMVILYNYMTYKGKTNSASADLLRFADGGEVADYAQTAVSWLVEMEYIVGDGTTLRPKDNLSRAETAVILVTAVNNQSEYLPVRPDPNMVGKPEDNKSIYPDGVPSANASESEGIPAAPVIIDEDFDPTPDNIATFPGTSAANPEELEIPSAQDSEQTSEQE